MGAPLATAEDVLQLLDEAPAGLSLEEIVAGLSHQKPACLLVEMRGQGQITVILRTVKNDWLCLYRLSTSEFLRRAKEQQHAEQTAGDG